MNTFVKVWDVKQVVAQKEGRQLLNVVEHKKKPSHSICLTAYLL